MRWENNFKKVFFLSVCLAVSTNLTAQLYKNELGVSIGVDQNYFKDSNFSPFSYNGKGSIFKIQYRHIKPSGKEIFETSLDINKLMLQSTLLNGSTDYLSSKLSLNYLRRVSSKNKLKSYLGLAYQADLNALNYDYADNYAFSFLYANSLNVKAFATLKIKEKQVIYTSFSLPFFVLLARPPYNGSNEALSEIGDKPFRIITNGDFTSFNQYLAFDWQIGYQYPIGKRLNLQANYTLQYQKAKTTTQLIHLQNQFLITLGIQL